MLTPKLDKVGVSCPNHGAESRFHQIKRKPCQRQWAFDGNIGELSTKHGIFSNKTGYIANHAGAQYGFTWVV